jgi:hypothetical protein
VRDLGIFISRDGWAVTAAARAEAQAAIRASEQRPFVSAAERYFDWSGFTEHEPDDIHRLIWQFIDAKQGWPAEARVADRIAALPEVDVKYFEQRVPDLKYAKMFLGWPDHNDQFTLWSHGKITISSQSVGGNDHLPEVPWHPQAEAYSLQFAVGDTALPRYREYGDENVHQRLENGHDLIAVTSWQDGDTAMEQTNFAVPLHGNEIRTGLEPLVLWNKLTLTNARAEARDAWLGVAFTAEDFKTFRKSRFLQGIAQITWRDGAFYAGDRLLAVADPALQFEALPAHGDVARFRARVALPAKGSRSFTFANLYRLGQPADAATIRAEGYAAAQRRMLAYWDAIAAQGATIRVPDAWLNNLYRTFLPRILICSHLDPDGMAVLHTSPIQYARVWQHITAMGIAGDLAPRGQFALARKYFEPFFKWQGIPAPDSPAITDWRGFFGAPPIQCARVWITYQGFVLWAAERYYRLSGDRAWLDAKLPALIDGMDWIVRNRQTTPRLNPDGTKPFDYGWLPPGRAGDADVGTSLANDASLWLGLDLMAGVLRDIGHPRAAEFQAQADDYRRCLQDGERRAAAERPLLRLNDDTWVPYLPAMIGSAGHERELKYAMVADGGWAAGIFDTHVFPAGSPEARWVLSAWEDAYSPLVPGLCDEPFTLGIFDEYLESDRIASFLYAFSSMSANTLDRETLTTYEHRSWGQKRAFELTPWAAGYWTATFAKMLGRTVGNELWLLQATPRRWLADGESIEVKGLQTEFGPLSFTVRSRLNSGRIEARVEVPARQAPAKVRLRLRVPEGRTLRSVTVNGREWREFDPATEWITLPAGVKKAKIEAKY